MSPKSHKKHNRISAVIDIGTSAIRLLIAEFSNDSWRRLDSMEKKTELGRDVFNDGEITRNTMLESLKILKLFMEAISSWKIPSSEIQVIGTSALREAQNRDVFIDRVFIRSGYKVRLIEGVEANQLTFTAVQYAMKRAWPKFNQANSVITEISGGSTELMLLNRGKIVSSNSLNMGTVRIAQQLKNFSGNNELMTAIIHDNIANTADTFEKNYSLKKIQHFIALGGEMRLLASKIGIAGNGIWKIAKEDFTAFIEKLRPMNANQIASTLLIPISEASTLLPALSIYQELLERTAARQILIPDISIRDGLLIALGGKGPAARRKLKTQILASTTNLGKKFRYDEQHAQQVASLSLILFDALKKEHALGEKQRLLLEVAATLHDIGLFINQSAHHKHGYYIIKNSEIFGLNKDDLSIVSHVVRYHRKALPSEYHSEFNILGSKARISVMKLAAILRLADSLDAGHAARIKIEESKFNDEIFNIYISGAMDKSLECLSLSKKADLFEEIYGMKVKLINRSQFQ
ncbi:MAG: HD domain-containing protein [Lentisphaeraceae bacterium]|nr:HD domain-containing protein [Lentisphaeraceae bacterium]